MCWAFLWRYFELLDGSCYSLVRNGEEMLGISLIQVKTFNRYENGPVRG